MWPSMSAWYNMIFSHEMSKEYCSECVDQGRTVK